MKIITICGSMRFSKEMQDIACNLAKDKGWCVLQCVYNLDVKNLNEEQIDLLKKEHLKRIDISNAIYVVNINNYIGDATKSEIEYAYKKNKEVLFHENSK